MARLSNNLLQNIRGGLGKQLVFKQYGDKTVVTNYLDMSKVKPSQQQIRRQEGICRGGGLCQKYQPEPTDKSRV